MGETSALPINTGRAAPRALGRATIFGQNLIGRSKSTKINFRPGRFSFVGALRVATIAVQSTIFATQEFTSLDTANDWIDRRSLCAGIFSSTSSSSTAVIAGETLAGLSSSSHLSNWTGARA